jgi:hypothetical protein
MAYLDLGPMLQAMRARPQEFEMQGSYLRHLPSHHLLNFDIWGSARVHARCDCAMLNVSREQSEEMKVAIAAWKVMYWEPRLAEIEAERRAERINKEFASHFRPSRWRRVLAFFGWTDRRFALTLEEVPGETVEPDRRPAPTAPARTGAAERELIQN